MQVENNKLKNYGGDYEVFLEKNAAEAEAIAGKEVKVKEQLKKQIKSKNKVSPAEGHSLPLRMK